MAGNAQKSVFWTPSISPNLYPIIAKLLFNFAHFRLVTSLKLCTIHFSVGDPTFAEKIRNDLPGPVIGFRTNPHQQPCILKPFRFCTKVSKRL